MVPIRGLVLLLARVGLKCMLVTGEFRVSMLSANRSLRNILRAGESGWGANASVFIFVPP